MLAVGLVYERLRLERVDHFVTDERAVHVVDAHAALALEVDAGDVLRVAELGVARCLGGRDVAELGGRGPGGVEL
jgi:hypothetical protein